MKTDEPIILAPGDTWYHADGGAYLVLNFCMIHVRVWYAPWRHRWVTGVHYRGHDVGSMVEFWRDGHSNKCYVRTIEDFLSRFKKEQA